MTVAFPTDETIAAIATAITPGQGGIAVVRISGTASLEIVKNIVSIPGGGKWESHRVQYGHVIDKESQEKIDEVLVLFMKGPRSFTGEDVVEIHCHGGRILVNRVLEKVLHQDQVRLALPGEFSQRAVLNGRLDLTQAEAISELVAAKSVKAAQLAMAGVDGGVQRKMTELREMLLDQLSEIEARVDFEEDLPTLSEEKVLDKLRNVQAKLEELIHDTNRSNCHRQGLKVALIGCPNVGKSSLLNRLSRSERAIVTDFPGTTRDLVESEINLEGVPITLLDTAGIRATDDAIERLGIAKSHHALQSADVIVVVFDLSIGWTKDDQKLLNSLPNKIDKLLVGNKADIKSEPSLSKSMTYPKGFNTDLSISALTGEGEEAFINSLLKVCGAHDTQGIGFALNERQLNLTISAVASLKKIKEISLQNLPWDFWTIDLRDAINSLGEITGCEVTEALLDRIFSRFCIGK